MMVISSVLGSGLQLIEGAEIRMRSRLV
jgi:hypothetical protein